jgi:hypothetical protein
MPPTKLLNHSVSRCETVPLPEGRVAQLTRAREGDQFLQVRSRDRRVDDEDIRHGREQHERGEIAHRIVRRLLQRRRHGKRARHEHHRVAVGRRLGARIRADHAAATAAVVDDDLLAEYFAQFLPDGARDDVGACARRVGDDQPYRPVRIAGLRVERGRGQQQRGCAE